MGGNYPLKIARSTLVHPPQLVCLEKCAHICFLLLKPSLALRTCGHCFDKLRGVIAYVQIVSTRCMPFAHIVVNASNGCMMCAMN